LRWWKSTSIAAWQRQTVEVEIGINGLDAPHRRRVVREVLSGPEADLEDAAARRGERALAGRVQQAARHGEVEQPGEDVVVVEGQVGSGK
jgi:hypothetical protein